MLCIELRGISSSEDTLCYFEVQKAFTVTCGVTYSFGATDCGLEMLQKPRRVKKIEDLFGVPLINVLP